MIFDTSMTKSQKQAYVVKFLLNPANEDHFKDKHDTTVSSWFKWNRLKIIEPSIIKEMRND